MLHLGEQCACSVPSFDKDDGLPQLLRVGEDHLGDDIDLLPRPLHLHPVLLDDVQAQLLLGHVHLQGRRASGLNIYIWVITLEDSLAIMWHSIS